MSPVEEAVWGCWNTVGVRFCGAPKNEWASGVSQSGFVERLEEEVGEGQGVLG